MALKKTYTIEIQMDAARQALADATQKLGALDEQLAGLDRNSDAAKAIVAEMSKLAKEVDGLTDEVNGLGNALDNLKPGSLGALKEEAKRLEAALEAALVGSADADQLIAELGRVKAEIKDIDEKTDSYFSRDRAGALVDAASGLAASFQLATVAAQNFGLTEEDADAYNQKLLEMISVVQSLEQIHKLTTGEVSTSLKALFGDAKKVVLGYFGIGQASTAASGAAVAGANVTRLALASLGIGLVLAALFLVYSNWEKITGAVKRNKDTIVNALAFISPPLYGLIKLLDYIEKKFGSLSALASGVAEAFKQGFATLGDEVAAVLDGDFAGAAKIYENRGKAVAQAFHRGVVEKNLELSVERSRLAAAEESKELARRVAVLEAGGKQVYAIRMKQLLAELTALKSETAEEIEVYKDKYNEIIVLQTAHNKELADAAEKARKEAADAAEKARKEREQKEKDRLQKEFEDFKARQAQLEKLGIITAEESERRKAEALAALQDELGRKIAEGTAKKAEQIAAEVAERAAIAARGLPSIGDRILLGLFGVSADKLEQVKQVLADSFASIQQSISASADMLLSAAFAAVDARLEAATSRLDELDQQLATRQSATDKTEAELDTAKGARREYLIGKLQRERAEEEKTRAARAKAVKEEQAAQKERHRLEGISQKLSAASTLASTVAASAKAIEAGVDVIRNGAAYPFPANIAAIAAGLAAVTATVISARNLGKSLKLEQGGLLDGPRHSAGGIKGSGAFGHIEVEGGEFVVNRWATAQYLPLLRSINEAGRMRVMPAPQLRPKNQYEQGGQLPTVGGAGGGAAASMESLLALEAKVDRTNALLERVAANTGAVAGYGPASLAIGPEEALKIAEQRETAQQIKDLNSL